MGSISAARQNSEGRSQLRQHHFLIHALLDLCLLGSDVRHGQPRVSLMHQFPDRIHHGQRVTGRAQGLAAALSRHEVAFVAWPPTSTALSNNRLARPLLARAVPLVVTFKIVPDIRKGS